MTRKIPPTTYALLGLLSLQPWTTYELARQSDRSLRWFFPRAERGVYQEAKRLVDLGWATATATWAGRRRGTSYEITDAGRTAFEAWLGERPAPLQIDSEGLVRAFLAGPGRLADVRANVVAMGDDARAALEQLAAMAGEWSARTAPFRDRGPTNAVTIRLVVELHRAVAGWATWAEGAISRIEAGGESALALADEVYDDIAADPAAGSSAEQRPESLPETVRP
jgi:DNA-binding PadR family transcriptional regulator